MSKGLKLVLPSAVTDTDGKLRKLEHYYGIEFLRGASNGGGDRGYYRMIGDENLLKEMRFHNQIKIANVKDATVQYLYDQINWNKTESGADASVAGADGSDVMQIHTKSVYAILGGTNSVYERFIVSDAPFTYDGDVAKEYTQGGDTPDYVTIKDNKLRSIYDENVNGTQWNANAAVTNLGDSGIGDSTKAGGFPTTNVSRFAYEAAARARNASSSKNTPYAPYNNFDLELLQAFMFIEFRTKQLNNYLGHGVSSNVTPTADTWGKVTGARVTFDDGKTYTYLSFGSNVYPTKGTGNQVWQLVNSYTPLLKMFEVQRAVSNGATLENVTDADGNAVEGLADGVMTGIYTKTFSITANIALTANGDPVTANIDFVLRVPVWRGRTRLWGNLHQWTSGYELIESYDGTNFVHKVYRAKSIEGLMTDSDASDKTDENAFAFKQQYDYVGQFTGNGGWGTKQLTFDGVSLCITADGGAAGAGRDNYESSATWIDTATLAQGTYRRRGARFGADASSGAAVLRGASVGYSPAWSYSYYGSGLHVTLED